MINLTNHLHRNLLFAFDIKKHWEINNPEDYYHKYPQKSELSIRQAIKFNANHQYMKKNFVKEIMKNQDININDYNTYNGQVIYNKYP